MPSRPSDAQLIARHRAGDRAAFGVLHARHAASSTRLAEGLVGASRADDVVQEAFAKAHGATLANEAELRLGPWLHAVVRNRCVDELRGRRLCVELDAESLPARGSDPQERAELRQQLTEIGAAIRALPARQRQALVWHAVDGAPHEAVAERLDASVAATKGLVNRARRELRHSAAA